MYPTANYEIAKARVADFHQDAKRDALARAARQAPKHSSRRLSPRIPVAARRVFTVLAARA
jgi:hypothetical protein